MQRAKATSKSTFSLTLDDIVKPALAKPKSAFKQFCSETYKQAKAFISKADLRLQWEGLDEAKKLQIVEEQAAKRKAYNALVVELRKEKAIKEALELCTSKIELLSVQLETKVETASPKKQLSSAFKVFRMQQLAELKDQSPKFTRKERRLMASKAWNALKLDEKKAFLETSR